MDVFFSSVLVLSIVYVLGYELFILGNRVFKENNCCSSFAPTFLDRRGTKLFGNAFLSLRLQTIFCSAVVYSFQTDRNICTSFDMVKAPYIFFLLSVNNKENFIFLRLLAGCYQCDGEKCAVCIS